MSPHAEPTPAEASAPQTNGVPESSSSKTIEHLQTFPVVSSLASTVTSLPLAQRALNLIHTITAPFIPLTSPVQPYISKADSIADENLTKIETAYPIVKETPENLRSIITGYPYKLIDTGKSYANEGKEYVFSVYNSEFEKTGKTKGVIPVAKAGVASVFVVSQEVMTQVAAYLGKKKESSEKAAKEKESYAQKAAAPPAA